MNVMNVLWSLGWFSDSYVDVKGIDKVIFIWVFSTLTDQRFEFSLKSLFNVLFIEITKLVDVISRVN